MKHRIGETAEEIEVGQYKVVDKGALKASFSLVLYPHGQKILDCRYFEQEGNRWFSFPSKEIKYTDGRKTEYIPIISYLNKEYLEQLKTAVLGALKETSPQEYNGKAKSQTNSLPAYQVQSGASTDWEKCPF